MQKWVNNVLEVVGRTPMIFLRRTSPIDGAQIFAKFEAVNPGGSIKTRTAMAMIEAAEAAGLLKPDSIIVEVTSGNQGIAMAMIGAVKGYKVKIVMPENMSIERRKLIQAYGAEVILTPAGKDISEAHLNPHCKWPLIWRKMTVAFLCRGSLKMKRTHPFIAQQLRKKYFPRWIVL